MKGKVYFESIGRREAALGISFCAGREKRSEWPMWARRAYVKGWLGQSPTLRRVSSRAPANSKGGQ